MPQTPPLASADWAGIVSIERQARDREADLALRAEIERLPTLDLHDLRALWRLRLRSRPPGRLTRPLLMRLLAYKLQAHAHGDLDAASARTLDKLAHDNAERRDAGGKRPKREPPPVPPVIRERGLMPGTLLIREHAGTLYRVVVTAHGFRWEGATYTSLSEIARTITGTKWNGPRFFGLRARQPPHDQGIAR